MVKLDNWETKAERALKRRIVTKQLKNQKAACRKNKALGQELLSFLDEQCTTVSNLMAVSNTNNDDAGTCIDGGMMATHNEEDEEGIESSTADSLDCDDSSGSGQSGEDAVVPPSTKQTLRPRFEVVVPSAPTSSRSSQTTKATTGSERDDDKAVDEDSPVLNVHIWTDSPPSSVVGLAESDHSNTSAFEVINDHLSSNPRRGRPRSQSDVTSSSSSSFNPSSPKTKRNTTKMSPQLSGKRSNNYTKKKNYRPRSNSNACDGRDFVDRNSNSNHSPLLLPTPVATSMCTEFFFCGSCSEEYSINNKKKKKSSKNYDSNSASIVCSRGCHGLSESTLYGVMMLSKSVAAGACSRSTERKDQRRRSEAKEILQSSKAMAESKEVDIITNKSHINYQSMAMVYHIHLQIRYNSNNRNIQTNNDRESGIDNDRISDSIASYLKIRGCSIGSIVYMSIDDGLLIFDRYKGGIVLSDTQKSNLTLFLPKNSSDDDSDKTSMTSDLAKSIETEAFEQERLEELTLNLPTGLLEHVLLFLPEACISTVLRVCKNWNSRIGKTTPNLWRSLGHRRDWPVDTLSASSHDVDDHHEMPSSANSAIVKHAKEQFMIHYTVVRTVDAMCSGVKTLCCATPPTDNSQINEFATILLKEDTNDVNFLKQWSSSRIVVSTSSCRFLVYDVVKTKQSGSMFRLKQVVDQTIGESLTRGSGFSRRFLLCADSDRELFGCILRCTDNTRRKHFFQCIQREALLCSGVGGVGALDDDAVTSFSLDEIFERNCRGDQLPWNTGDRFRFDDIVDISECRACGERCFLLGTTCEFSLGSDEEQLVDQQRFDDGLLVTQYFILDTKSGELRWAGGPKTFSDATSNTHINSLDAWISCETGNDLVLATNFGTHPAIYNSFTNSRGDMHREITSPWIDHPSANPRSPSYLIATSHGAVLQRYLSDDRSQFKTTATLLSLCMVGGKTKDVKINGILRRMMVRKDHLIMFSRNFNGANSLLSIVVISLPHMSIIHQNNEVTEDSRYFDFPLSASSSPNLNGMLIRVGEKGLVFADPTLVWSVSKGTESKLEADEDAQIAKKKKSSKRRSNSGKDGYARGMRMNV